MEKLNEDTFVSGCADIKKVSSVVSLFSGCGGLDLGFSKAGFNIVWANEFDKDIWETYEKNHVNTFLEKRNIKNIFYADIPDCLGIIGGPPCQSWSEAGNQAGISDERGQLFLDYIQILKVKQPLFFLAENVSGMLHKKHSQAITNILNAFKEAGYNTSYKLLNALYYNVPQDRKRVIFIGYRYDLKKQFDFNRLVRTLPIPTLKQAIWNLKDSALPAQNNTHPQLCAVPNHEYMQGSFSSIYMSRNRVRLWNEPSFTIQAGGRHAPIHPQANRMIHVDKDKWIFDPNSPYSYRRLSVRECARTQTFPDEFIFYYKNLTSAYKMIGNAVPVNFAYAVAKVIKDDLQEPQEQYLGQTTQEPLQLSLNLV
ncbi:DNA cytosine methyltransferase [Gloeocapsopsis sp. IPPAS B-1203]|uniref:DNA cytosine methyltransferase n=1 Tax=Gloeocapsopsis sp. IPPAS B-1203 TaxID=2049454 RepID=UPI000C19D9AC|nr:DNA cytosine methyltransferase [Gloeocapsopsis sp. IPPAS B-1203]PIG91345.1 DNA (cytosine-5-)-methyltransferase [Gloeocapsopsis sp. IPPAS B-1203]